MDTAPESSWGGTGWVYRAIQHTCREAQYLIEKRLEWVQGIGQVCTFVVSNGNVFWRLNLICSSNSETWNKRGARGVMMRQRPTDRQSSSWQPNLESVPVPVQSPFSEIHWQWYHQSVWDIGTHCDFLVWMWATSGHCCKLPPSSSSPLLYLEVQVHWFHSHNNGKIIGLTAPPY